MWTINTALAFCGYPVVGLLLMGTLKLDGRRYDVGFDVVQLTMLLLECMGVLWAMNWRIDWIGWPFNRSKLVFVPPAVLYCLAAWRLGKLLFAVYAIPKRRPMSMAWLKDVHFLVIGLRGLVLFAVPYSSASTVVAPSAYMAQMMWFNLAEAVVLVRYLLLFAGAGVLPGYVSRLVWLLVRVYGMARWTWLTARWNTPAGLISWGVVLCEFVTVKYA